MKKYAFTIVAAMVFAALLAFVLLNKKNPQEKSEPEQFFTVLEFIRDDLQSFEIMEYIEAQSMQDPNQGAVKVASRVALKRSGDAWTVIEPGPPRADQSAVDTFLYNISSLQVERKVEDNPADLDKYGLKQPHYEVKAVMKSGKQHVIQIGELNELANGYYLKIVGKKPVYIVPRNYMDTIFDGSRLIDKSLVSLDYGENLMSATVTVGDIQADCVKKDGQWALALGGDEQDCNYIGTGLFDALLGAQFTEWFPAEKLPETPEELGLAPARILVHAVTDRDNTVEIAVGKQVMDKVFVKNVTRGEVYLAPVSFGESIMDLLVIENAN